MLPIQVLVTTNEGEIRLQVGGAHRGSTKVLAIIFLQQTDRQLKHAPPGGVTPPKYVCENLCRSFGSQNK